MNLTKLMKLFQPQSAADALRAPSEHEAASITSVLLHIPTPRLAQIADEDLGTLVDAAIDQGGGIHQIGLAPTDLEIQGDRFVARCDLRLSTMRRQIEISFKGAIDERGRVAPEAAILLAA